MDEVVQVWDDGAEAYERLRPDYPAAAVDVLTDWLDLREGRTVVDVGAGTGKLTRAVVTTGVEVVAVEPLAGMREQLRRAVPQVEVRDGTAETLPFDDRSLDGAVAGQAFHWFDATAALTELRRVIRPPARVGLLWNTADREVDWVREWHERIDALADGGPRSNRPASWIEDLPAAHHELHVVANDQRMPRPLLRERIATTSWVAALGDDERARFLDGIDDLLDTHEDTRGRDVVVVPTSCHVHLLELEHDT